jgi:hypothetical protein
MSTTHDVKQARNCEAVAMRDGLGMTFVCGPCFAADWKFRSAELERDPPGQAALLPER